ncbi:alanine racemase [Microlunatus sp. Gsoil 973]|uniref:alanine racemase n=1 Tax=Microlunatus sp. Gsoil 973 TaxID=2672569 RepID=UPI001E589A9A|nr:alanine racemase [Microlunatus sp. Gsoil 973]
MIDLARHDDQRPWQDPASYWPAIDRATAELDPPFAVGQLTALRANLAGLITRAAGKPIRIASKSLRVRGLIEACLAVPGIRGVLAYTLAEAIWLSQTMDDLVLGYPTADRSAVADLVGDERAAERITIMIDDPAHLDLIDSVAAPQRRPVIKVAIELDASLDLGAMHLGVFRSPLHTPEDVVALARNVLSRRGFRLVGLMAYEAQIAGVGDLLPGHPLRSRLVQVMQRRSAAELTERRTRTVAAVRSLLEQSGAADLDFVNGGGTGSIGTTTADPSVTEIAAGSGIFGPHLFDNYRAFSPAPAVAFALPVVRRPRPDVATVLGGGGSPPARRQRIACPHRSGLPDSATSGPRPPGRCRPLCAVAVPPG